MTDFNQKLRDKLAKSGEALPDGSFPIRNKSDLKNAIQAIGRAKDPVAAKKHIISRARTLGLVSLLPEGWVKLTKKAKMSSVDMLTVKLSALDSDDLDLISYLSESYDDNIVELSPAHSLATKPGLNNWIEKTSPDYGLPDYIGRIAQALVKGGMNKSRAIATAISQVKKWAAGLEGVNADTRAKAQKAVAAWEKLKAENKARSAAGKLSKK